MECKDNIYDKLKELDVGETWMDFSNYPPSHPNFSMTNHLVPGKFKDEGGGIPFIEGVFLRSKMYSLNSLSNKNSKSTAKGIDRTTKERELTHEKYVAALNNDINPRVSITKIMSKDHSVFTVVQSKAGLSNYNDKVFVEKQGDIYKTHSFGFKE